MGVASAQLGKDIFGRQARAAVDASTNGLAQQLQLTPVRVAGRVQSRSASRMISLVEAYSPCATVARRVAAISAGMVMVRRQSRTSEPPSLSVLYHTCEAWLEAEVQDLLGLLCRAQASPLLYRDENTLLFQPHTSTCRYGR
jgi:hypothetical protein